VDKLVKMTECPKELEPILKQETKFLLDRENYRDLRALERDFQLIVDTMILTNLSCTPMLLTPRPDCFSGCRRSM